MSIESFFNGAYLNPLLDQNGLHYISPKDNTTIKYQRSGIKAAINFAITALAVATLAALGLTFLSGTALALGLVVGTITFILAVQESAATATYNGATHVVKGMWNNFWAQVNQAFSK